MKTKYIILFLLLIVATSCTVTKRRYTGGWQVEWHKRARTNHDSKQPTLDLKEDQFAGNDEKKTETLLIASTVNESHQGEQTSQSDEAMEVYDQEGITNPTEVVSVQCVNIPADTTKKREKWVPYKYRKQQFDDEKGTQVESEGPKKRSVLLIILLVIASLLILYLGFGTALGLAALCLAFFDFSVTVSFWAYLVAFIISWPIFALTLSLLLRVWIQVPAGETEKAHNKRLWKYAMLIALGLTLIALVLLGVAMFL